MQKVELGGTGIQISEIGFGGMPLSIEGRPPETEARKVIEAALDEGITFIDTADVYCLDDSDIGHNERLIASVLGERKSGEALVATKGGLRRPKGGWTRDGSPRHLREACEKSLRALGVDQIFLYQLHAPDPKVPFEASLETLAELQREGKVKYLGLSNVTVDQIRVAQKMIEVASVQNRLNPFFREAIETGVIDYCDESGITFLAYSPVGGGRLSKKLPAIAVLEEIAKRRGVSPHAVVLAWVRTRGKRVVPIPGASKARNAIDSARSGRIVLSQDELDQISATEFSTK